MFFPHHVLLAMGCASTTLSWPTKASGFIECTGRLTAALPLKDIKKRAYQRNRSCPPSQLPGREILLAMGLHSPPAERNQCLALARLVLSFFLAAQLTWYWQQPQTLPRWRSCLECMHLNKMKVYVSSLRLLCDCGMCLLVFPGCAWASGVSWHYWSAGLSGDHHDCRSYLSFCCPRSEYSNKEVEFLYEEGRTLLPYPCSFCFSFYDWLDLPNPGIRQCLGKHLSNI